jgi:hypothetical protein
MGSMRTLTTRESALEDGISFAENGVVRMRKAKTGAPLPLILVKTIDSPNARDIIEDGECSSGDVKERCFPAAAGRKGLIRRPGDGG